VGLWWGTLWCGSSCKRDDDGLDGPGLLLNMVGKRGSFNPWHSFANMLGSSLDFF